MGKYETLGRHLQNLTKDQVEYNFKNIQDIIGFPLPESARLYRPWWSNDKTHVQARDGWIKFGWLVDTIDFSKEIVRFYKNINYQQKNNINNQEKSSSDITPYQFENIARLIMSKHFSKDLYPQKIKDVPKLFDLVSTDHSVVGDAKYLTMVGGISIPPAKFATIAEYVWLLEKINAKNKFLVFGNDKRVPLEWLKRYGNIVSDVEFYFIDSDNNLKKLK